jgi:hypothetical protein
MYGSQVSQFYVVDRNNGEILAQLDAELSEIDLNASTSTGLGLKGKAKNIRSVRSHSAPLCAWLYVPLPVCVKGHVWVQTGQQPTGG